MMSRTSLIFAGLGILVLGGSGGWGAVRLTAKERAEAKELYADACASCHGENGMGQASGTGVAVELPDFTWCAFNADETDRDWSLVVAEGGPAGGRSE